MEDQIDGEPNWSRIKLMEYQTDAGSTFVLHQVAHV